MFLEDLKELLGGKVQVPQSSTMAPSLFTLPFTCREVVVSERKKEEID